MFCMYSVLAGFFWFGAELMVLYKGEIDPKNVYICIFVLMLASLNSAGAGAQAPDMGRAEAAVDRVFEIFDHESPINAVRDDTESDKITLDLSKVRGEIEFEDVWFRYPTRKEDFVLRGLNLKINPSESCALVGESGCGKSTFINLMMRFYDPGHGRILLDGIDIATIKLHSLRTVVSLVMQEPNIFNFNILENILYGKLDATNTEVLKAAQLSNCVEFIEKKESQKADGSDETA
jgi:ATP-binding cassette subfamily B (MDR/TAP) protein 1